MLYPLRFTRILVERVWGGQTLARYGKNLPANKRIGESWEISDRDEAQSVVANGPDKGKTLRRLIEASGHEQVVGTAGRFKKGDRFPLLIKLLDARERLSLQVHPPPEIATQLGGQPKTEMWHVLETDPGARLFAGFRRGITREQFEDALRSDVSTLPEIIHQLPVNAGDSFFIPAGRIHAIDAGVTLLEVQQNSDTTYRVYDWGRPREVHIVESLASINFEDFEPKKIAAPVEDHMGNALWRLVECEYFCVQKFDFRNAWLDRCDGSSFHIIGCVRGGVGILTMDGKEELLNPGEFALLPAALGIYTLAPQAELSSALKIFLPGFVNTP
jgi:mannose-6-phosphate isomerase